MPPAPLRIALISEHASPLASIGSIDAGGQNIYVLNVAKTLARCGHQVDVLTRRDSPSLPATVDVRPGMRVVHLPAGPAKFVPKEQLLHHMPAFLNAARELLLNSLDYDVIHAHFFMSGLVGLRLKEIFGVPLAMTFHALGLVRREHQGANDGFPPVRVAIERCIVRDADRLIAECPQDETDLQRLYGARAENISTVPCGVDLHEFGPGCKAGARRELGLDDAEFLILQLGRMVPRKGVDNVVRALALLGPDVKARLLVVGGESARPDPQATPEIGRLQRLAEACGVADRVTFTGQRQRHELRACYQAADVFVTTPWYEPFGITPLEAMASGTPVIGSAVGGIKHSVVDGITGFLVPPHDPAALAERLRQLHENRWLGQAMGRSGVRRVRALFTWDRVAADLTDVYHDIHARSPERLAAPQRITSVVRPAAAVYRIGAHA
ncbi:MAG: glycosyltransferase family 1 protein [Pseudomonadota bacterium]|nr:glycosyltransferase family 1 protein [Pseudomonadota bacterium]